MFNVKNDLFAQKQVDDTTQTRFGVLLSFVVLPSCLILYSCLWFVTFYLGLGAGSPPTYKVITTETLQFGNSIFPLTLKCSSYEGCFFRLPGNAVQTCAATSLVDGDGCLERFLFEQSERQTIGGDGIEFHGCY